MTYDEVMELVRNARVGAWAYDPDKGISTLRADVDIRIEEERTIENDEFKKFGEDWATQHPDGNARRAYFSVYHNASLVKRFMLISVDGGRALLPYPDVQTKKIIPRNAYLLARAVDQSNTLDEYIERSKLTVGD